MPEPLVKSRNFDPESRALKKRTLEDAEMEDTVENRVKGLAEQIIADDEKRRAQELVRSHTCTLLARGKADHAQNRTCSISRQSDRTGT